MVCDNKELGNLNLCFVNIIIKIYFILEFKQISLFLPVELRFKESVVQHWFLESEYCLSPIIEKFCVTVIDQMMCIREIAQLFRCIA